MHINYSARQDSVFRNSLYLKFKTLQDSKIWEETYVFIGR
jgi:hypothetical protein